MNCTVPKCRGRISGMTGLQELEKLRQHFKRAHKVTLTMGEALEVRIDLENGQEPNILRAMLGTNDIGRP